MECTQRLECTQELYDSRSSERVCPEQIGFLGICGVKHPVKRGPNKIGRDPQTCSIVLNLNSISRQHAVINVLNQTEYMLMDLDSANKTKIMDKTLPPYIPHPLKNGDMVQFGDIFGVFRLLEEDNELPMTQAIDLPETPVPSRHISKLNRPPVTTVPESPDVSDREESFIAPSQPKGEKCFKNSQSTHFIKPSAKIISIQPVGSHKIDNVYWNSSKKSVSLDSQLNDSSLNDSLVSDKSISRENNNTSIFEMETQQPTAANDSLDSIYTAETQVPKAPSTMQSENTAFTAAPSIYTADTQIPATSPTINTADTQDPTASTDIHTADTQNSIASPSIHNLSTQLPLAANHLPEVCKIENQQDMQLDMYPSHKQNNNIFEAETQDIMAYKYENEEDKKTLTKNKIKKNLNVSDEVILFDDIDCQQFEDAFESQPLLQPESLIVNTESVNVENPSTAESNEGIKKSKKDSAIHSDSSTDCEDIDLLPTQKITLNKSNDDEDLTDCEDVFDDAPKVIKKRTEEEKRQQFNFEDMLTQVIDDDVDANITSAKPDSEINLEDMPTQIIIPENDDKTGCKNLSNTASNINIDDMPTQIIVAEDEVIITEKQSVQKDSSFEDMPTQVISDLRENASSTNDNRKQNEVIQDFVSPFKIPLMSPIKIKRKDIKVITPKSKLAPSTPSPISKACEDDNYYAATQEILDDLCTQQEPSSFVSAGMKKIEDKVQQPIDDEFLPSSVEDYEVGQRFPHLDHFSPRKKLGVANKSSESSDGDEKVNNFVSNLSSQQIREMVGVESNVATLKRAASDVSDVELTPKKVRPIFMDIDLPSSQEIKTSVSMYKTVVTESSSESEFENDSEECTPILFHKKKKPKVDAKVDLRKVFEAETLPTRVITRIRKPTSRLQDNGETNKLSRNILKQKYLTEQEDEIDNEIITENITRLKNKSEKARNKEAKDESKKYDKVKSEKENEITSEEMKSKVTEKNKTRYGKRSKSDSIKSKVSEVTTEVLEADKIKEKSKDKSKKVPERKSNEHLTSKESETIPTKAVALDTKAVEPISILKNTRSTRNRAKAVTKETSLTSTSDKDNSQNENKSRSSRRQNNKKTIEINLTEEVTEVRRSGRQKKENSKGKKDKSKDKAEKSLEKIEKSAEKNKKALEKTVEELEKVEKSTEKSKKAVPKRGRPPTHEQSTVYSLSSDSGTDSPRNVKRSATGDLDPPSPKRTRSAAIVHNVNTTLRSTPARLNKNHFVLFTAFPSEEVKTKLEKLGAVVVSDVAACSVVLTMAVKRTFKLLCAVGLGRPIVGPAWVQACVDTNMIVDPWLYILKDEAAEKRFQFSLERTLTGKRNFLKGFNVSATPSVMPSAPEMKLIVECSGGTWGEGGAQWACVSCAADRALWPALRRRGAALVATEFILGGVLRQRPDVAGNRLH